MTKTAVCALRGMQDILPKDIALWQHLEKCLISIAQSYGYLEIRFPLIEKSRLFEQGVGQSTDIVTKEMYRFTDKNQDTLTLRPEGTAVCVRAGIQHGLFYHNKMQRLWYLGPMFRHERPQKGRYRQFHQFGVEAFKIGGPDIEAELIRMGTRIWQKLGLMSDVALQINTLGSPQTRLLYRNQLSDYFEQNKALLDRDSLKRLNSNPLRILDSKNPALQPLIQKAPTLLSTLDTQSKQHFSQLTAHLDALKIPYTINPRLVRGLDYYTGTVFEWVTNLLGAQDALCAGGRYDGLVSLLGGQDTKAVGFALGLERVVSLMQQTQTDDSVSQQAALHAYVVVCTEKAKTHLYTLTETWQRVIPTLRIIVHCGDESLKHQLKCAHASGARVALIVGEKERALQSITVKYLSVSKPQKSISLDAMLPFLQEIVL